MEKIECDRCRGKGTIKVRPPDDKWYTDDKWYMTDITRCPKCKGVLVLDWIEMIKGVDESKLVKVVKKGTLSSGPR